MPDKENIQRLIKIARGEESPLPQKREVVG